MNFIFCYTTLVAGPLLWGAPSTCVIKGTVAVNDGLAVLHYAGLQDSCRIHGGRFAVHHHLGCPAPPVRASLDIHPGNTPGYTTVPVILETGEVHIRQRDGRYSIGGTPDNDRYQHIRE